MDLADLKEKRPIGLTGEVSGFSDRHHSSESGRLDSDEVIAYAEADSRKIIWF